MNAWESYLLERGRPLFGQVVLTAAVAAAMPLAGYFLWFHGGIQPCGSRTGPVSVLSWVLPDALLLSQELHLLWGLAFVVGAVLWLVQRGLPWSSWLATAGFTGVVVFYLESASQVTHVAHLTNLLLIVHALWYHFYAGEIRTARLQGRFWRTPLYPRWVHALSVLMVGLFYGLSGWRKLIESGPGWANGVSLQLWAQAFGDPDSWWTRLILADRRIARGLQVVTLVGETAGLLAVVCRPIRPLVGLLLVGFHVGQVAVFGWGFHANIAYLLLLFLPVDRWLGTWRGDDG